MPDPLRHDDQNLDGVIVPPLHARRRDVRRLHPGRHGLHERHAGGSRLSDVNLRGVTIDDANIAGRTIFGHDIQALIRAELARRG